MLEFLVLFYMRNIPPKFRRLFSIFFGYHSPFFKNRALVGTRDFIQDYNALVGSDGNCLVIQNKDLALRALHHQFKKRGIRSELLGDFWWGKFAEAITLNDKDGLEIQALLRNYIIQIPAERLIWWEWLAIYNLLLKFGLFNIAYILRIHARKSILIQLESGRIKAGTYIHLKALGALVESRSWDLLKSEINKINALFFEDKYFLDFLNTMTRDLEQVKKMNFDGISSRDTLFYEFNYDKKIAFVGPAKSKNKDGAEIDAFDVVAKANHKNIHKIDNSSSRALRCDISYYNGRQSRRFYETDEVIPDGLSFAVAVENNFKYLQSLESSFRDSACLLRSGRNYRSILMQGSFHAMPNAIFDLLRCHPKEIKVFHADLMLTVNRYKGYKHTAEKFSEHAKVFLDTLTNHDPMIQWSFLEIPYKAGLLKGDAMFERVMNMGEEKYMHALQKVYGDCARLNSSSACIKV